MAIIPATQYPGKITAPSAEYPQGKAKNITVAGDGTGTPWDSALVNDIFGFQQHLLGEAGIVPSGTPDDALVSDYFQALADLFARKAEAQTVDGVWTFEASPKSGFLPADPSMGSGLPWAQARVSSAGAIISEKGGVTIADGAGNYEVSFPAVGVATNLFVEVTVVGDVFSPSTAQIFMDGSLDSCRVLIYDSLTNIITPREFFITIRNLGA